MATQCWIHAHPVTTPWLQPAMRALRGLPDLQLRLLSAWPEAGQDRPTAEPDVVVLDAANVADSCRALQALRASHGLCRAVVVTPTLEPASLQQLARAGADDFIAIPVRAEELAIRVQRTLGWQGCTCPPDQPRTAGDPARSCGLVGDHPAFLRQLERLRKVASTDVGVLLLGETGTGKELFAQAVHYQSSRASGPWVAVNCGALPLELVESELFGHVKGAYTHAVSARPGLVRQAEGGSLFLDEIDSLPVAAQSKLLRFLQDKEVRPVGANAGQRVDVRLIAASNRSLPELVASGQFRQDLYFRLNVVSVELPSLRERRSDIPALSRHFVQMFSSRFGRNVTAVAPAALRLLMQHSWPGNVRELMHVIERAVILTDSTELQAGDLDAIEQPAAAARGVDSMRSAKARLVSEFERSYIEQVLAEHGGNITQAARAAQKNRRAFFALMRKYQVATPAGPSARPQRGKDGWPG